MQTAQTTALALYRFQRFLDYEQKLLDIPLNLTHNANENAVLNIKNPPKLMGM